MGRGSYPRPPVGIRPARDEPDPFREEEFALPTPPASMPGHPAGPTVPREAWGGKARETTSPASPRGSAQTPATGRHDVPEESKAHDEILESPWRPGPEPSVTMWTESVPTADSVHASTLHETAASRASAPARGPDPVLSTRTTPPENSPFPHGSGSETIPVRRPPREAEPQVHIHIGSIELRAAVPAPEPKPRRREPAEPPPLSEFLRSRDGRR
jgi:hypothetical protein